MNPEFMSRLDPDIVLPCQFGGGEKNGRFWGERRLCIAILEDALAALKDRTPHAALRAYRREAARWVLGNYPLFPGFPAICEVLKIDVDAAREALRPHLREADPLRRGEPVVFRSRVGEVVELRDGLVVELP